MEGQENVIAQDSSESSVRHETKENSDKKTFNYKITSPNNPLYDLVEKQAKEFEEFGKKMSLDLQTFYNEYLTRQKGIVKVKNSPSEIEKVCKEFEEMMVSQSQLIDSLKSRIEELETNSTIKDQNIKKLRDEFNESVKIISEQNNKRNKRRDSLSDQFSEMNFDSISEITGDDAIFLHDNIITNSGTTIMKCKKCDKTFINHVRFMFHAKEKHQYKWLCLVCYQVFLSGKDRGIHMRKNHKKEFSCTLCTKECYDITGLREHFRAKHPRSKFPSQSFVPLQSQSFVPSQSQSFVPSQSQLFVPSQTFAPPQMTVPLQSQLFIPSQTFAPPQMTVPLQSQSFVPSQTFAPLQTTVPPQMSVSSSVPATSQQIIGNFIHEIVPYQSPSNKMPPYQLKCKICKELFSSYSLFNTHARKIHGYKHLCLQCSQLFNQKSLKNRHMDEDHSFKCQVCSKELHSVEGLISHCKAKKHQYNLNETIYSIYSTLRENYFMRGGSLHDPNEKVDVLTNDGNVREDQKDELDKVKDEIEKDSDDYSDLFDSFDEDDDDTEENEGSVNNDGDDADEGINFPKCEECQLYFRDAKQLESHNKYHYQNIF